MTGRVAIIGGGYLDGKSAKSLDAKSDVTLIEQCSLFVHTIGHDPDRGRPVALHLALILYDSPLAQGSVVPCPTRL